MEPRTFQIALREGKPAAVMSSYNPVNGVHASQNGWLPNDVLKGEWDFRGLVMSDGDSCYDTLGRAQGGLGPGDARRQVVRRRQAAGGLPRPPRELKAHGKVCLQAGESKVAEMEMNTADPPTWNPAAKQWAAPAGKHALRAGDSSRDLPRRAEVEF